MSLLYYVPEMLLMLLVMWLMWFRLGATTLNNWDEAWLASVARDGDWNGETWFYEPPLVTWELAGIINMGGVSEFWLRQFFVICGMLIMVFTYLTTLLITKDRLAGLLASLVVISDIELLFRSRQINTDVPLTLFLLLALYAFMRLGKKWWLVGWISWGLAFLTKRATPLLLVPSVGWLIWRQRKKIDNKLLIAGFGLFLIIVLPWHLFMWWKFKETFVSKYIIGYTIGKITSVNPTTGGDYWFYVKALKHAWKFFSLLLPFTGIWMLYNWKSWQVRATGIFFGTFFALLTLAPIKASWYMLPIHPLLAVMMGGFLAGTIRRISNFKYQITVFLLVCMITGFQLTHWREDYIVLDTTAGQAEVARLAGSLTKEGEKIYLDDDYLPVAVFYSHRKVIPLRFNRLSLERKNLPFMGNDYLLTNLANVTELVQFLPDFRRVLSRGDLLLLKVMKE